MPYKAIIAAFDEDIDYNYFTRVLTDDIAAQTAAGNKDAARSALRRTPICFASFCEFLTVVRNVVST